MPHTEEIHILIKTSDFMYITNNGKRGAIINAT